MPVKDLRPLKDVDNVAMLNAIRGELSLSYQNRVPEATKANMDATIQAIVSYSATFNEFIGALVNRIGLVYARQMIWTNPLAVFKRGMLTYGDTIEEIYTGLLKAHVYDPDRENMERMLFGTELPPVEANFHRVNRQEFYKFTVNPDLLKRAFLDENGLQQFIQTLMSAPVTSDNWDEFLLTTTLFAQYEKNGGFYHVNVPNVSDIDSNGADARLALRKIRSMVDTLRFPSTNYNASGMPVFAEPSDLVLFTTPEFKAAIDVEALAAAFNMDRMNIEQRIITIPADRFGIDGCQAILTTEDFFVIADQKVETTSIQNPASLHENYFLHHWEVISCSRFVPAVMFWTGATDPLPDLTVAPPEDVTDIVFTDVNGATVAGALTRGFIYQATSTALDAAGEDSGILWAVTGHKSSRTHITETGVLHVAPDEPATSLTVTAIALHVDPAAPQSTRLAESATRNVEGQALPDWPVGGDPVIDPDV